MKEKSKIITIPNILSFLRLCMIPVFIWLYCIKADYTGAIILLLLSGLTDVLDGFIARKFNMVSDFGKALDPIADKLTQASILFCLLINFSFMWPMLLLLFVKEILVGATQLMVIKKTGVVYGAEWHGKLTTCCIYGTIFIHLVWHSIPTVVSNVLIVCTVVVMLLSCVLYVKRNLQLLKQNDRV